MSEPEENRGSVRNLSVDAARLAAAFGVILIHLAPSTPAAEKFTSLFLLFAVPYFLTISLVFFINRVNALRDIRLSDLRIDRILVPYVVWSIAYTLLRLLKLRMEGRPMSLDWVSAIFFGGSAVQLYFLPLLLFFQALALSAILLLRRGTRLRAAGICVGIGAVAFGFAGSQGGFFGFEYAVQHGILYGIAAVVLAATQSRATGALVNMVIGALTVVLLFATAWCGQPLNSLGTFWEGPVVGYGVSAFALNVRLRSAPSVVRALLTCSFGIYLAHVAFLEAFEIAARKSGHTLAPYGIGTKSLMAAAIFVCCVALVIIARLHPLTAYLLLGERGRSAHRPRNLGPASAVA